MSDSGSAQLVGNPASTSSIHADDVDAYQNDAPTSSAAPPSTLQRTASTSSTKVDPNASLSRGGTLKKSQSLKKKSSLSRRNSRRSLRAGSMKGRSAPNDDNFNSVFHTPVPTTGNPTEVLADRFQSWRKLLKDLITYFREIQTSYEHRSKALLKISNVINNTTTPPVFMSEGGLDDATRILRGFHKQAVVEANKAKDIGNDVITQLGGLRSDLTQKIKEIKSLSGDFKNSVEKEKETTKKAVSHLQDALSAAESDPSAASGKNDPFIIRLGVDRQVEKQIEEENYLHRAYLNLEGSGRELESIVVGEIQKAYNAYAGILKREADQAHETVDDLRSGPIAMPKDHEWNTFVENDSHFVNPNIPIRSLDEIHYPGKFDPLTIEIRGGMLERKSKYLKSYTPGWYVLSPTHLHEFKSADHIYTQTPVMSLYLVDQKLGSHSQPGASSHKFSLKGRQTGGMHRGHSWVFRAESYDTMLAWYEDIKNLTEKTGEEKTAFVRKHARSVSGGERDRAPSISSDGMAEDEADAVPYAANAPAHQESVLEPPPKRPEPGGRFGSDVNIHRTREPLSPSSGSSDNHDTTGVVVTSVDNAGERNIATQDHVYGTTSYSSANAAAANNILRPGPTGLEETHEMPVASTPPPEQSFMAGAGGTSAAGILGAGAISTIHQHESGGEGQTSPTFVVGEIPDPDAKDIGVSEAPFVAAADDGTSTPSSTGSNDPPFGATATEVPREELTRTGKVFPAVVRHSSALSASELQVPGGYPPSTMAP